MTIQHACTSFVAAYLHNPVVSTSHFEVVPEPGLGGGIELRSVQCKDAFGGCKLRHCFGRIAFQRWPGQAA